MDITAAALWLNTVFADMDEAAATSVHYLYEVADWFFTPFLEFVSFLGLGGIILILLGLTLTAIRKTRFVGTAILLALAIDAFTTSVIVKPLIMRPRPYTVESSVYYTYWQLLGCHTEFDYCFPSGHTAAAMAFSTAVFGCCSKKVSWIVFFFPFAMGVSRVYLSVHYCSDVLGGLVIGLIAGIISCLIARRLPEIFYSYSLSNLRKKKLKAE